MRLVVVAEEAAGIQVLRALGRRDHEIVAVMAQPERPTTAGASVWAVARAMGHQVWPAKEVRAPALAQRLRTSDVDVVLNVHSLYVVNDANIDVPRFGWYNLHPGPLPEYAGLNSVGWAIHNGEPMHGVTVHRMVKDIDAGAICYQERFPIEEGDTALSLSARCVRVGVRLLMNLVEALSRDQSSVPSIPQDPARRRVFRRNDVPGDGKFAWTQPARTVVDFIRSFDYYPLPSPWGYPHAALAGRMVGVIGAKRTGLCSDRIPGTVAASDNKAILVACDDEWVSIRRLHHQGQTLDASSILDPGAQAILVEEA